MALLGRRLAVSIPDTVLEEKESLRDRTAKLGLMARACSIYGVDVIEVFRDQSGRGGAAEIRKVLEYLETPQYLRKRIYPLDETLRYAGVLPPLRIPSHRARVAFEEIPPGQVREGVVNADGTVDVGLDVHPRLQGRPAAGSRVTVRISSLRPPVAELVSREKVGEYWGYRVEVRSMPEALADPRYGVKIATSRLGTPLAGALGLLGPAIRGAQGIKLIFGSPSKGLNQLAGGELAKKVDFVVNLFPGQQVETVRTEEAVFTGLGLLGFILAEKA